MANQDSVYKTIGLSDVSHPLGVLPEGEPLCIPIRRGLKRPERTGWQRRENRISPARAIARVQGGGNYGLAVGRGTDEFGKLVVVDAEEDGVLPPDAQALVNDHALMSWDSPHGGHNRLLRVSEDAFHILDWKTKVSLTDDAGHDVELITGTQAIGPGSRISHEHCDDSKQNCPSEGIGQYELRTTNPEAPLLTESKADRLAELLGIELEDGSGTTSPQNDVTDPDYDYDQTDVAYAGACLTEMQSDATVAFKCVMGRLQGGTGFKDGLRLPEGRIDRSQVDLVTASDLYGVMLRYGDEVNEGRAKELAYAVYSDYCTEQGWMKDGRPRKWNRDEAYRRSTIEEAVEYFDNKQFSRFLNKKRIGGRGEYTDEYSRITYGVVQFAQNYLVEELPIDTDTDIVDQLCELASLYGFTLEHDRASALYEEHPLCNDSTPFHRYGGCLPTEEYPTKQEVVDAAQILDPTRSEESHDNALKRFRRDGTFTMACIKRGVDYRYYPSELPDPEEVEFIRTGGEKRGL